ncbi:MAG: hypothetical protein ACYC11_11510 [Bellilinea sp.]
MIDQIRKPAKTQPFIHAGSLGFHYFPDTLHYTERDLQQWLPVLLELGANWLVIRSDTARAIPETFITTLKQAGISPFIQFHMPLGRIPGSDEISPLISAYIRWGATHIQFYDRPNIRASWSTGGWTQQDLVERFLDRFLPLANQVVKEGAVPVMPALEPGGNYWDTAFLRAALLSMERRGENAVLEKLALSAYAWTHNHPLDWGAGGPEFWPDARPYFTPASSQDHLGFRIYQWYLKISEAVLERACPIFLMQAGLPTHPDHIKIDELASEEHSSVIKELYTWVTGKELDGQKSAEESQPVDLDLPSEVEGCNFWLLSAGRGTPYRDQAWFHSGNPHLPHAQLIAANLTPPVADAFTNPTISNEKVFKRIQHPISHYILMANGQHGGWEQQLARMLPYINKNHSTVGFSIEEAALASRITIVGKSPFITKDTIARLLRSGSHVEQIDEDGTVLAS